MWGYPVLLFFEMRYLSIRCIHEKIISFALVKGEACWSVAGTLLLPEEPLELFLEHENHVARLSHCDVA